MPANPGEEREKEPSMGGSGAQGLRFPSDTKPSLRSECRAELLRTLEMPTPLCHRQIWGQMGNQGMEGLSTTAEQDCGAKRATLAKLPVHPHHHPILGPCSLLPLAKHLGVLCIFRPLLTGCEIAPFAPP